MHIFFCWSGERSRKAATALSEALLELKHFTVFLSPQIPKGEIWFERVAEELGKAEAGILVLTPENVRAPWLHFEAGALALGLRRGQPGRLYTYLFGLEPTAVGSPLNQYQHTLATEQDTTALVEQMLPADYRAAWGAQERREWWKKLAARFRESAALAPSEVEPRLESMFRRKTFAEPLRECSDRAWVARYIGARSTHEAILEALPTVKERCRRYAADVMADLAQELDAYAMAIRANLIVEREFELNREGRLEILPEGIAAACERRRERILRLQAVLADEARSPVFEEAHRFECIEQMERKKDFIHRKEADLAPGQEWETDADWRKPLRVPAEKNLARARTSEWALDRILFYVIQAQEGRAVTLAGALDWARDEVEKLQSKLEGASRMPLHYSLDVVEKALRGAGWRPGDAAEGLGELMAGLEELEREIEKSKIARRVKRWKKALSTAGGEVSG